MMEIVVMEEDMADSDCLFYFLCTELRFKEL